MLLISAEVRSASIRALSGGTGGAGEEDGGVDGDGGGEGEGGGGEGGKGGDGGESGSDGGEGGDDGGGGGDSGGCVHVLPMGALVAYVCTHAAWAETLT